MNPRPTRWTMTGRALRLVCPNCGQQPLFRGWLRMHEVCAVCRHRYERQPGYFLGSIYINYGLTALVVALFYPWAAFGLGVAPSALLWGLAAFCVLFPVWFFRYARALWIAFDLSVDPPAAEDSAREIDPQPGA